MAANNWGDPSWGNQMAGPGGTGGQDATRNENVYALRDNDSPQQWAQRVWAQSTADYGRNNLNPYSDQNPLANSPFAKWYQSRYGTSAPTGVLANNLVSDTPMNSQNVANELNTIQKGVGTSAGAYNPMNDQGAVRGQLHNIGGMLNNFTSGNRSGQSPTQQALLDRLNNDPALATQMIMGQMQGVTGGWGMDYMGNRLNNLATHYYNDPANQGPEQKGSFFNQAMQQLGI